MMGTVLDVLGTIIFLTIAAFAFCALGAIGIALWLFHTWDEAERKRKGYWDV